MMYKCILQLAAQKWAGALWDIATHGFDCMAKTLHVTKWTTFSIGFTFPNCLFFKLRIHLKWKFILFISVYALLCAWIHVKRSTSDRCTIFYNLFLVGLWLYCDKQNLFEHSEFIVQLPKRWCKRIWATEILRFSIHCRTPSCVYHRTFVYCTFNPQLLNSLAIIQFYVVVYKWKKLNNQKFE